MKLGFIMIERGLTASDYGSDGEAKTMGSRHPVARSSGEDWRDGEGH